MAGVEERHPRRAVHYHGIDSRPQAACGHGVAHLQLERASDQGIDAGVTEAPNVPIAGAARYVAVARQQRLEESRGRGIVREPTIEGDLSPGSRVRNGSEVALVVVKILQVCDIA